MFRLNSYGAPVVLAALWMVACGGSKPPSRAPTQPAYPAYPTGPQAAAPQPVASPQPSSNGPFAPGLHMNANAQTAYQRGTAAFRQGDLAAAKAAFQQAASADPQAYEAYQALGVVQERQDDASALTSYRQAFTIQSNYEPAMVSYGLLLARRGNLSEADSFFSSKRAQFPQSAAMIAGLAEVKSMGKDTAAAQQLAQEALKKNSDYRPAMVTLARDHYRNRRLDLALYALQAILDGFGDDNPPRDRDNAEAHNLRAIILKEEGRRAPAMAEFKRAVELRPDLVEARVELAAFYLEAGNAADADPLLAGALKFNPNHVTAHLNLGDAYRLEGRIAEAKAQFEWVLAHDATLGQVHYDLALLYLFAPSVPGMDAKKQTDLAISEIGKYQQMRGKSAASQTDDSEELMNRAKQKLADLQVQGQGNAPAPAPQGAKPAAPAANKPK